MDGLDRFGEGGASLGGHALAHRVHHCLAQPLRESPLQVVTEGTGVQVLHDPGRQLVQNLGRQFRRGRSNDHGRRIPLLGRKQRFEYVRRARARKPSVTSLRPANIVGSRVKTTTRDAEFFGQRGACLGHRGWLVVREPGPRIVRSAVFLVGPLNRRV